MAALDSFVVESLGDLWAAIKGVMILVDRFDFLGQLMVVRLAFARGGLGMPPGVEPAAGDSKKVAKRLDFKL